MKKWAVLLGALLCMILVCCTTKPDSLLEPEVELSEAQSRSLENDSIQLAHEVPKVVGIVVNRKNLDYAMDNVLFGDSNEHNVCYIQNVIRDIVNLKWIAEHGGCGNDPPRELWTINAYTEIIELPVIQHSNRILSAYDFDAFGSLTDDSELENAKDYTWIRLVYEPFYEKYREKPDGSPLSQKDLLIYVDPENQNNAILAQQIPDNADEWILFTLPDYGSWLTKEVDMLLRMSGLAS